MAPQIPMLGLDELTAFQNQAAANNPLLSIAPAVGQARFDMRTWDPMAQLGTSFAQSFLSGALGAIGRNQVADQVRAVAPLLPQLYANPGSVSAPEGTDPAAFETLKSSAALRQLQRQSMIDQMWQEALMDGRKAALVEQIKAETGARLAGDEAYNKIMGENRAWSEMSGGKGAIESPDSPAYKVRKDQTEIQNQLADRFAKAAATFKYKEQGLRALVEAYADPAGTSDFEIIRRGAQAVEPGLAVRVDDERSLQGAASALGMTTQFIKSVISGDTKLSPEVRAGIMRIAKRAYESELPDYNTIRESYLERAKKAGVDETAVVPFGAGQPFDKLYGNLDISIGLQPESKTSGSIGSGSLKSGGQVVTAPDGNTYVFVD